MGYVNFLGIIMSKSSLRSAHLRVDGLSKSFADRRVFAPAKSGLAIGLLHQQPDFPSDWSCAAVLEASVAHLRDAEAAVTGLGLDALGGQQQIMEFSGGQRARLAMASLLLSAPEALLLDEPTNHLDDAAIQYSEYLESRRAARQRWQQQYEEEQAKLQRLRASVDDNQVVGHRDWKHRTETRAATKFYADRNARVVARRVNDARARLDAREQRQIVKPPSELTFHGLDAAGTPGPGVPGPGVPGPGVVAEQPLVTAHQVALEGRLEPTTVTLSATDRLLVSGANGAGKSTLLHILAGSLTPSQGTVQRNSNVRIGLLTQESTFRDVAGSTAQAVYEQAVGVDLAARVLLATFGLLSPRDEQRNIESLSTGQQRRLALAGPTPRRDFP